YTQKKRNAYKINPQTGVYGNVNIDVPKLYGQLKLIAHKDGKKVYEKQVDFDTHDLLTKRFNSKKKYSPLSKMEDVIFDLETALNTTVANNANKKKDGYRFVIDNSGEVTPFDWYNARISLDFKVNLLANGGNIALADHNGIVNGSYSFLKQFDIKLNGKKVYDCNDANHAVNIKNLLDYSPSYAKKQRVMSFFYLHTSRSAEEREFEVSGTNQLAKRRAAYNKGFALRKPLLGTSSTINTEIPLNRYSFFELLEDELLPNTRVEMNFEIETDDNLIWQAGANCRVVITRIQLYVPRITFNSEGQSSYMNQYLKTHKRTYLREKIERSNSSRQRAGHFRISTGISKPRHFFVFIINDVNIDAQTANPFLYNTFSFSTDPRTLSNCHLKVGNGNEYPEIHYTPATDMTRVYRDVLKDLHKNNEYDQGSLLNKSNFSTLFPFLYFDLTKQKMDIKDGTTKLTFKYKLSGTTATAYSIYALTLKLLPMAMPLAKKAIAPLATGVLSGLTSLRVDKMFGKGRQGGFLIPQDKIAQLIKYKHLLSVGQKNDILNHLQSGGQLVIKPTRTQQGGFSGTLLASIGAPLLLNALTGKGLQ
ncbi:unnamed protein product, partial [Porites evermanni]